MKMDELDQAYFEADIELFFELYESKCGKDKLYMLLCDIVAMRQLNGKE